MSTVVKLSFTNPASLKVCLLKFRMFKFMSKLNHSKPTHKYTVDIDLTVNSSNNSKGVKKIQILKGFCLNQDVTRTLASEGVP